MSISTSLQRATKLQEKIDELRSQLAALLDQTRSEMKSASAGAAVERPRRGRPKGSRAIPVGRKVAAETKPQKLDGRSKAARALKVKRTARKPHAAARRWQG